MSLPSSSRMAISAKDMAVTSAVSTLGNMKRPVAAGRGAGPHLFAVVPGKPEESILTYRMASTEPGVAMPELGKDTVDKDGLAVVRRWIADGAK